MTLFDYLHLHPWWALIYLLVIASAVPAAIVVKRTKKKKSEGIEGNVKRITCDPKTGDVVIDFHGEGS